MNSLSRAYDYPYERPPHAMIVRPGRGWREATPDEVLDAAAGRTPVIACGSNGSPVQLDRKYAGSDVCIPVLAVGLVDQDTVFTAQLTTYGAVPAALHPSPGTVVRAHITFLTDQQLIRMDATEFVGVDYERRPSNVGLATSISLADFPAVELYHPLTPPLLRHGEPVALTAIHADGRRLPAWAQRDVLRRIAAGNGEADLDRFVGRLQTEPTHRREIEKRLQAGAATSLDDAVDE